MVVKLVKVVRPGIQSDVFLVCHEMESCRNYWMDCMTRNEGGMYYAKAKEGWTFLELLYSC